MEFIFVDLNLKGLEIFTKFRKGIKFITFLFYFSLSQFFLIRNYKSVISIV